MTEQILSGLSHGQLEATATTLDAMKRSLPSYLQGSEVQRPAGPGRP